MERVCCMCGDVGFPSKLFRCGHCRNRFQHSYCSNYYREFEEPVVICDWCRSDDEKLRGVAKHGGSSGIKHNNNHEEQVAKKAVSGAAGGGVPSPRTPTRRYKLLKDVMC